MESEEQQKSKRKRKRNDYKSAKNKKYSSESESYSSQASSLADLPEKTKKLNKSEKSKAKRRFFKKKDIYVTELELTQQKPKKKIQLSKNNPPQRSASESSVVSKDMKNPGKPEPFGRSDSRSRSKEIERQKISGNNIGPYEEVEKEDYQPRSGVFKLTNAKVPQKVFYLAPSDVKVDKLDSGIQYDDGPVSFERFDKEDKKKPQPFRKPDKFQPEYSISTGLFSDGIRRADYVLVIAGSYSEDVEDVRVKYLSGLIRGGFQLEAEASSLPANKNLQFIKLHAPDSLLVWYPSALGMSRYFREAHEDFVDSYWKHEREWLRLVRSLYIPPLYYSNLERSNIVHTILHCHRFGDPGSFYEIKSLLRKKIIFDAYPLHDGPYFNVYQRNFLKYNTRQVLFLNWVGLPNIFKPQPLHMINEYFGSKLAFYFTFYEFYNRFLFGAAIWGVFMTILYLIKDADYLGIVRKKVCSDDRPGAPHKFPRTVCVECRTESQKHCPYTLSLDHCPDLHVLRFVDNPYMVLYSVGISFGALLFLTFWRRTQCYYNWMWEEWHSPEREIIILGAKSPQVGRPKRTFTQKAFYAALGVFVPSYLMLLLLFLILTIYMSFYTKVIRPVSVTMINNTAAPEFTVVPKVNQKIHFLLLVVTGLFAQVLMYGIEKIFYIISYFLTKIENHRTLQLFENALIMKYFTYSFLITMCSTMYVLWIKGIFYNTPGEIRHGAFRFWSNYGNYTYNVSKELPGIKNLTLKILSQNCAPFSCFYESVIIFFCTVVVRLVGVKIVDMVYSNIKAKRVLRLEEEIPSTSEREFGLQKVTENQLMKDYNGLFLQLALVMLFAPLFPLAPVFLLFINLFDVRMKAYKYVVSSRRVMFFNSPGIGHWNFILTLICYSVPLFHSLILAKTEIFKLYTFRKSHPTESPRDKFYEYMMKANYNRSWAIAHKALRMLLLIEEPSPSPPEYIRAYSCRVDGFYHVFETDIFDRPWPIRWNYMENNVTGAAPLADHYHAKFMKAVFVLAYVNVFALISLIIRYYTHDCPSLVSRARLREETLKRLHHHTLTFKSEEDRNFYNK